MKKVMLLLILLLVVLGIFYFFNPSFITNFNTKDNILTDTIDISKQPLDKKNYEFIQLDNGLKIFLIQDTNAKLSAVSLSVAAGSTSEPDSIHGLAHYLEHMLFLGSKDFPKADSFMEFVSQNGGSYNAYTASDETNFFFSINPIALDNALARFSDFFYAPLLTEEFMQREQQAVNAEYTSKLQDNFRRSLDAMRQTFNPKNPLSHFSAGNAETLAITPELRPQLLKFFNENYKANNMSLVVLTPDDLKPTKQMLENHFARLESAPLKSLPDVAIFSKDFLPAKLEIQPLEETYRLQLYFPTPNPEKFYTKKPDVYLSYLITDESKSSLFAYLKNQGWILSLVAGSSYSYKDESLYTIQLNLTPEGFKNLEKIKALIFNYLALIKQDGIQEWRFTELNELSKLSWNFKEGEDPLDLVMNLASSLKKVAPKDILKADYIFDEFDAKLIGDFLAQLTPSNMLQLVVAPQVSTEQTTKWLKTPYKITKLTKEDAILPLDMADIPISLPEKNIYIAEQKIIAHSKQAPQKVFASDNLDIWSAQDASFNTPKVYYKFEFNSKLAEKNAKNYISNKLFITWISDAINESIYHADLANLETKIEPNKSGLIIGINGLSAKSGELLSILLQKIKYQDITPARFAVLKEDLLRKLANKKYRPLTRQMLQKINAEIMPPRFEDKDLIMNLRKLSLAELEKYRREFLLSAKITAFLYGNVNQATNEDIKNRLQDFIHLGTSSQYKGVSTKILATNKIMTQDLHIENPDRGFVYYIQADNSRLETRAKFSLLTKLQSAEFFYQLRTLQQLGYIVANANKPLPNAAGLLFLVQSPKATLAEIYQSVTEFLQKDQARIDNLSEQDFAAFKSGLINLLEKPDENLATSAARYWQKLLTNEPVTDDRKAIIEILHNLTLKDMQEFYADILAHKYGEAVFTGGETGLDLPKLEFIAQ